MVVIENAHERPPNFPDVLRLPVGNITGNIDAS